MKLKVMNTDLHKETHKLIGVSVPHWIHNYMSLYCLAKKKTKSKVIWGLLDSWHTQIKTREPIEKLVQDVIDRANKEWNDVQMRMPEKKLAEFKDELDKELRQRGLNPFQVNIILKAVS